MKVYQQIYGSEKRLKWTALPKSRVFKWFEVSITLPPTGGNSGYRVSFVTIIVVAIGQLANYFWRETWTNVRPKVTGGCNLQWGSGFYHALPEIF